MNRDDIRNIAIFFLCQIYAKSGNLILLAITVLAGYSLYENKSLSTLPLAMQYIGVVTGAVIAANITIYLGRKKSFMLGGCIGVIGSLGACFSLLYNEPYLFCFSTFIIGIYNAFGMLYRFAVTDIIHKEYKGAAISYVLAGGLFAAFLGSWLVIKSTTIFITSVYSGGYLLVGLMALLTIITVKHIEIPHVGRKDIKNKSRNVWIILRQKGIIFPILSAAIIHTTHNFVITLTPLFMSSYDYSYSDISSVVKFHILAMFGPSFFTGKIIKLYGQRNVFLLGLLFLLGALFFAFKSNVYENIVACVSLLGISWNFIYISSTTTLTDGHTIYEKEKIQLVNELAIFTTVAIFSFVSGPVYILFGWSAVISMLSASLLFLTIALAWSKFKSKSIVSAETFSS
jgi:MFS family permease